MSLPDVKVPGVFGNISPSLAYILLTSDGDAGDLQDADVLTIGPRMYMAMIPVGTIEISLSLKPIERFLFGEVWVLVIPTHGLRELSGVILGRLSQSASQADLGSAHLALSC